MIALTCNTPRSNEENALQIMVSACDHNRRFSERVRECQKSQRPSGTLIGNAKNRDALAVLEGGKAMENARIKEKIRNGRPTEKENVQIAHRPGF